MPCGVAGLPHKACKSTSLDGLFEDGLKQHRKTTLKLDLMLDSIPSLL